MSKTELMMPVEITFSEGEHPCELVFHLPEILLDRYQHALSAEFSGYPQVRMVAPYTRFVRVTASSETIASDPEFHRFVTGKIRSVLLRASLGR